MEIYNFLMPGIKFFIWKIPKIGEGKIPFPLPKPKRADILSSHSLADRTHKEAQPIGRLLLPRMLSHERVMQHAETEVNGMVESVQESHH